MKTAKQLLGGRVENISGDAGQRAGAHDSCRRKTLVCNCGLLKMNVDAWIGKTIVDIRAVDLFEEVSDVKPVAFAGSVASAEASVVIVVNFVMDVMNVMNVMNNAMSAMDVEEVAGFENFAQELLGYHHLS